MTTGVVGSRGRLGSELVRQGAEPVECDITSYESIRQALEGRALTTLVNCAAFSSVDGSEEEIDRAYAVNMQGVGKLRQEFAGHLIHISTGFVFNGKFGAYDEENIVDLDPLQEYGNSKLGGEYAVAMRDPHTIIRTLDLFGEHTDHDFVKFLISKFEEGEPFEMPAILYGNPTYIPALAKAILEYIEMGIHLPVLHLAGSTVISRYEFARLVAEIWDYEVELVKPTTEIYGAADRPLNASLKTGLAEEHGLTLLTAREGLLQMKQALEAAHVSRTETGNSI